MQGTQLPKQWRQEVPKHCGFIAASVAIRERRLISFRIFSALFGRCGLLPVHDNVQRWLGRVRLGTHQEALAVGGNAVCKGAVLWNKCPSMKREKTLRRTGLKD